MRKQLLIPILTVSAVAIIIITMKLTGLLWPFRLVSDQVGNPVGASLVRLRNGINDQFKFLTSIYNLNQENKDLKNQQIQLREQLSSLKEVARENELLSAQLNFNARLNFDIVSARVVSFDPDNSRRFVTLDRGTSSGLRSGQAVMSSGVLIGTVEEVNDYSSKIFLIGDPEFRIRAVAQDGRAQGVVRGQIGEGYVFEKIAQGETVNQGEQIVTTGSGLVPQGILIGVVDSVSKSENAIFQTANVRPLVDLNSLEIVFIVKGLKQ